MKYVITMLIAALAATVAPAAPAERPLTEEEIHALVLKAQKYFEDGELLWSQGDRAGAVKLFDRCHAMIMDAEQGSWGQFQQQFFNLYARYRWERSRYDGKEGVSAQVITKATEEAYGDNPLSDAQIRYYVDFMVSRHSGFMERSFNRALRYIPMIRTEFERAGVPPALAYMALVESGFREKPTSHAGAQGLWQFMPATARRFNLKVGGGVDERNDPVKATRAAAKYLKTLHKQFHDWPLAVAAYNCGEGRVGKALKRTGAKSFWELADRQALPRETIQYVPKIVAVTLVARDPEQYGFRGTTPGEATTR
jgi:hypothetical protein